jgi:hypothetical protein
MNAREEKERLDLINVLRTESGRRVIWKILTRVCRVFSPAFTGNTATFYNQGRREAGLEILDEVFKTDNGEYFFQMKKEAEQK